MDAHTSAIFPLSTGNTFLGKFGPKYKNCQFKDTMNAHFCYRHTLLQTIILSRLFYLL